jgi:hypothetical protein
LITGQEFAWISYFCDHDLLTLSRLGEKPKRPRTLDLAVSSDTHSPFTGIIHVVTPDELTVHWSELIIEQRFEEPGFSHISPSARLFNWDR